jgi:hypothetical protein
MCWQWDEESCPEQWARRVIRTCAVGALVLLYVAFLWWALWRYVLPVLFEAVARMRIGP